MASGKGESTGGQGQDDSCWDDDSWSWWDWQQWSGGTWSEEDWRGQSRNDGYYRSKNDEIREKARAPLLKAIKKLEEELAQSRSENAALSWSLATVSSASSQAGNDQNL